MFFWGGICLSRKQLFCKNMNLDRDCVTSKRIFGKMQVNMLMINSVLNKWAAMKHMKEPSGGCLNCSAKMLLLTIWLHKYCSSVNHIQNFF